MKFSVLLPSRNRLDLLKLAVETVLRQDYADWEIIISDNCSDAPIMDWVLGLNEPRIRYFRTESFVSVTANWNNALRYASGDYIIMLGDDDGLLPGYFSRMRALIEQHGSPEMMYGGAVYFCYPGVQPQHPEGYVAPHVYLKRDAGEAYYLPPSEGLSIARAVARFRMLVGLNMQYSLLSADFIRRMSRNGEFYHSPYPDFYATTVCFAKAQRLLVVPEPLVAIGISKQSFGFYFSNDAVKDGASFLNNLSLEDVSPEVRKAVLPGGYHNTCWLLAMVAAHELFPDVEGLAPAYQQYRRFLIANLYKRSILDRTAPKSLKRELDSHMSLREKLFLGLPLTILFVFLRMLPNGLLHRVVDTIRTAAGQHPRVRSEYRPLGAVRNLVDYFEQLRTARR